MKLFPDFLVKSFLSLFSKSTPSINNQRINTPPYNFNRNTFSLETNEAEIWISPIHPADKNQVKNESHSYFESLVYGQHEVGNINVISLNLTDESQVSPHFHIYTHPIWPDWSGIWKLNTLELDPNLFPFPTLEDKCHGAQFQIQPIFSHAIFGIPLICQGTSFVFKGFEDPSVRYIVEWCQWTDIKYAYLKVVGTRISGHPYPYNDPRHPTFILRVPINIAATPFPPLMLEKLRCSPSKKIVGSSKTAKEHRESKHTKTTSTNWIDRTLKTRRKHFG